MYNEAQALEHACKFLADSCKNGCPLPKDVGCPFNRPPHFECDQMKPEYWQVFFQGWMIQPPQDN